MTHKAIAGMLQRQWLAGDSSVLHNYMVTGYVPPWSPR